MTTRTDSGTGWSLARWVCRVDEAHKPHAQVIMAGPWLGGWSTVSERCDGTARGDASTPDVVPSGT